MFIYMLKRYAIVIILYTVNSREHVTHFECVAYQNTSIFKQNIGDL